MPTVAVTVLNGGRSSISYTVTVDSTGKSVSGELPIGTQRLIQIPVGVGVTFRVSRNQKQSTRRYKFSKPQSLDLNIIFQPAQKPNPTQAKPAVKPQGNKGSGAPVPRPRPVPPLSMPIQSGPQPGSSQQGPANGGGGTTINTGGAPFISTGGAPLISIGKIDFRPFSNLLNNVLNNAFSGNYSGGGGYRGGGGYYRYRGGGCRRRC